MPTHTLHALKITPSSPSASACPCSISSRISPPPSSLPFSAKFQSADLPFIPASLSPSLHQRHLQILPQLRGMAASTTLIPPPNPLPQALHRPHLHRTHSPSPASTTKPFKITVAFPPSSPDIRTSMPLPPPYHSHPLSHPYRSPFPPPPFTSVFFPKCIFISNVDSDFSNPPLPSHLHSILFSLFHTHFRPSTSPSPATHGLL